MGAGRPQQRPGGRPNVIGGRFSDEEAAVADQIRGALNRSEYVRWLIAKDAREKGVRWP